MCPDEDSGMLHVYNTQKQRTLCLAVRLLIKTGWKSPATPKKSKHKTKKVKLIVMKYRNVNKKGKISHLCQEMNAGLESPWPASSAAITVASAVSLPASANRKPDRKKIGTGKILENYLMFLICKVSAL